MAGAYPAGVGRVFDRRMAVCEAGRAQQDIPPRWRCPQRGAGQARLHSRDQSEYRGEKA